ncbi:hypothetical protein Tco_1501754 [Tanacetum coccineum]
MLSSFFQAQASPSGTLPSNTIPNPKGEMKAITTRSGVAYEGPSNPTKPSPKKVVEQETEEITDEEQNDFQGSTAQIPPPVIPKPIPEPEIPKTLPKSTPIPEPEIPKSETMNSTWELFIGGKKGFMSGAGERFVELAKQALQGYICYFMCGPCGDDKSLEVLQS